MDVSNLIDIKLNAVWQPTPSASGDFLQTLLENECVLQEIMLEALTQEGDLFVDESFGWSLMDFLHSEADEMLKLEIRQRIRDKLSWYKEIDINSINVEFALGEDTHLISISFSFIGDDDVYRLQLRLDRVNAEVVIVNAR